MKAFTDYPLGQPKGVVIPVAILSYDNDKYVTIELADGDVQSIKRGYLYKDKEMTRFFGPEVWHVLGGGRAESYCRRGRKTTYRVFVSDEWGASVKFSTRKDALRFAANLAKHKDEHIQINIDVHTEFSSGGFIHIEMHSNGDAELGGRYRNGKLISNRKFLRGHGKASNNKQHRRNMMRAFKNNQ